EWAASPRGRGRARSEIAIHVEDRGRIVLHEPELRHDLARRLLFLHLFGEEPVELGHLRERLLGEAQLVEGVDLLRDTLLVLERLLEHRRQRVERRLGLRDRFQFHVAIAGQDEVVQLHAVQPLLLALQAKPLRRAEKLLSIAESRHREIVVRRLKLGVDLLVDCREDFCVHRILQPLTGPPWKNPAGVITPSRLNTWPSFITNRTFFSASTSSSGLPGSAITSAKLPALIGPRVFSSSATL